MNRRKLWCSRSIPGISRNRERRDGRDSTTEAGSRMNQKAAEAMTSPAEPIARRSA